MIVFWVLKYFFQKSSVQVNIPCALCCSLVFMADKYSVGRFTFTCNLRSSYEPTRLFGFDGRRCGAQSKAQSKPTAFGEKNGILMIHSDYPNRLFSYAPSSGYRGDVARSISLFSLPLSLASLYSRASTAHGSGFVMQIMYWLDTCRLILLGLFFNRKSSNWRPPSNKRPTYRPKFKINKCPTD